MAYNDSITHIPLEDDEGKISSGSPVPLSFEPFSATITGQKVKLKQVNSCVIGLGGRLIQFLQLHCLLDKYGDRRTG